MYIKDLQNGNIRKYGTNHHDSLVISDDGKSLHYENLQNGEGSQYGDYRFVTDEHGMIPMCDDDLMEHGAEAYFNIGGFVKPQRKVEMIISYIEDGESFLYRDNHGILTRCCDCIYRSEYDNDGVAWCNHATNDCVPVTPNDYCSRAERII